MKHTAEITRALADPTPPELSQDQWAVMYGKVWDVCDQLTFENEHLKMQLLFYAGKDSKWPN